MRAKQDIGKRATAYALRRVQKITDALVKENAEDVSSLLTEAWKTGYRAGAKDNAVPPLHDVVPSRPAPYHLSDGNLP